MLSQCIIPDCTKPHWRRSFCGAHYKRWRLHGDPSASTPLRVNHLGPPLVRFWAKVNKGAVSEYAPHLGACWLWVGGKRNGYGRFGVTHGVGVYSHRFAYELLIGPIPAGLTIDHLCRVLTCVNPSHLEPVTNRENVLRGVSFAALHARKTHCPQGHPYSGDNLYIAPGGRKRECRECKRYHRLERTERERSRTTA